MSVSSAIIPFILAVVGGVWLGQGLGLITGSAMTSDPFWAAVGAILLALAALLAFRGRRGAAGR